MCYLNGMPPRALDPRIVNICYDSNALNRTGGPEDSNVDRFLELAESQVINLLTPKSVLAELSHPKTPAAIQAAALQQIYTIQTGLTQGEIDTGQKIRAILQGNAKPGKHDADASHLTEAAKYGGYFITHDQRILDKRSQLRAVIPPSLQVVTLEEFLAIYDSYSVAPI